MPSSPRSGNRTTPWIVLHRRHAPAKVRLFCFPFAGGGASVYRAWASELPEHIEVAAVQPPGRENRFGEAPLHRMDDLIGGLIEAALPSMREMPFAFFGHSLGAIVALETSRALARAAGPQPIHVIVSAHAAPHLPPRGERLGELSRDELADWLRRVNGTPEAVLQNRELLDLVLPTLRADLDIDDSYQSIPDPPLTCPLTVFGGAGDDVTPEELQAWASYTAGSFAFRSFEGGHFFAFDDGQSAALAAIAEALTAVH